MTKVTGFPKMSVTIYNITLHCIPESWIFQQFGTLKFRLLSNCSAYKTYLPNTSQLLACRNTLFYIRDLISGIKFPTSKEASRSLANPAYYLLEMMRNIAGTNASILPLSWNMDLSLSFILKPTTHGTLRSNHTCKIMSARKK